MPGSVYLFPSESLYLDKSNLFKAACKFETFVKSWISVDISLSESKKSEDSIFPIVEDFLIGSTKIVIAV